MTSLGAGLLISGASAGYTGVALAPKCSHTAAMAFTAWAHSMEKRAASNMPRPAGMHIKMLAG